jgi:hypothetical protein
MAAFFSVGAFAQSAMDLRSCAEGTASRTVERCTAALEHGDARYGSAERFGMRLSRALANLTLHRDEAARADVDRCFGSEFSRAGISFYALAETFYARGILRARKGDSEGSSADIRAAETLDPDIAQRMAERGLKAEPPKTVWDKAGDWWSGVSRAATGK